MSTPFATPRRSIAAIALSLLMTLSLLGGIDAIAQADLTPDLMARITATASRA